MNKIIISGLLRGMIEKLYSKKVLKYFKNPKNIGVIPDGPNVGAATVGNPQCGDVMKVYIKVAKNKKGEEFVKDIKVQTLGCGAAIATSSIATELVKGKPLKKALVLTNKAVAEALGGLPKIKMHCSVLAEQGIKSAIENYYEKQQKKS